MQLGLDLQYPPLGLIECRATDASVFTGDLLTFQSRRCDLAVPLRHVAGFPGLGLLRGLRPIPEPSADDVPSRRRPGWPAGEGSPGWFPRSPPPFDRIGAQLFPCSLATATPQAFPVASPPAHRTDLRSRPPK